MNSTSEPENLSDECFREFLRLTHELTGITIAVNRKSMVEGRLRKRLIQVGLASYSKYADTLKASAEERKTFIDLITTNETYFFRTPRIWDYIESTFLPQWFRNHGSDTLRIWSAAASSGEESYTLGVLCEDFLERNPGFDYSILGSDISQEMVGLCQRGLYRGRSIDQFRRLRPELFQKHMRAVQDGFQVQPKIRPRIRFQTHNLFEPTSKLPTFGLILLRNVLIYFTQVDQETVLGRVAPALLDDGALVIGESESLSHLTTEFQFVSPLIYSKLPIPCTTKAVS